MSQTMGPRAAAFIASEANGSRSRDPIVIASGAGVLVAGLVLGKVTASGKYAAYDNTAADGTETAAGILLIGVDATSADVDAVGVVRDEEIITAALTWDAANDGAAQTAGLADLAALGLIARS